MKKFLPYFLTAVLSVFITLCLSAQTSIKSTDGYTVTISARPMRIAVTDIWPGGYNYQVEVVYSLSFSGNNSAVSLWNSEGNVGCGSKKNGFALPKNAGSGSVYTYKTTADGDYRNASINNLGCNQVSISISASGIPSQTVVIAQPVILPVSFTGFTASLHSNKVVLNWSTASEENNKSFTVERSSNGTTWTALSSIKGAGTTTTQQSYTYTDAAPVTGTSFYRIRQHDNDGMSTISDLRSVKIQENVGASIGVYPIPNAGNTITLSGIRDYSKYQLDVLTTGGGIVYQASLRAASVELPQLSHGLYFIRITDKTNGEATSIRYVKN